MRTNLLELVTLRKRAPTFLNRSDVEMDLSSEIISLTSFANSLKENVTDHDDTTLQVSKQILNNITDIRGGAAVESIHQELFPLVSGIARWISKTSPRCWITLSISILIEIYATALTKKATDSGSFSKLMYAMALYVTSLLGFSASLSKIDVSIAYAVWCGVGTAAVSLAGVLMFGEKCTKLKTLSISMIILGVIGINLSEIGYH